MRVLRIALCVLLGLLMPGVSLASERRLKGQVVLMGEHDETTPAVGVDVTLKETGDSTRTRANGLFSVFLPDAFKAGERVTLSVNKPGWCIQYPLDGEVRVPADLDKQMDTVRLLPVGSKKLWSDDRFEKFVRDTAEKAKTQVKANGKPRDIDFSRYIKEWAVEYGFSAQQAKEEIDRWVAETEQKQDDPYKLGLAAYARKNFGKAGELLSEAAERKAKQVAQESRKLEELNREAAQDFRLAGDARYANYEFDKALEAYEWALHYVSRDKAPALWAAVWNDVGNAQSELGIRTEGDAIQRHLTAAVEAYRHALEVYTREQLPQQWAATQNNLGGALEAQGERAGGEEGVRLLGEAVAAYRHALEEYTREQLPQDWAGTQNNLGSALKAQGERAVGEEGVRMLGEAVAAYRHALEVYTRGQLPQQWAMTQNNLGIALKAQGERAIGEEGVRMLGEAVAAYRHALEVYTPEQLPQQWAGTQNNLGNALQAQGERAGGEEGVRLLGEAVAAYRHALEVRTREQLPQDWAGTQNNLGAALQAQGERAGGEEGLRLLGEAVKAYRHALEVRTREHLPRDWAHTQRNLAGTYRSLMDWRSAVATCTSVLDVVPDDANMYRCAAHLNYSKLFSFADARVLHERWLKRHPDDLSARADFSESQFTTAQFAEAEATLTGLLATPGLKNSVAVRSLEIAVLLVQGNTRGIPGKLEALRADVAARPEGFKSDWDFEGTRHFIRQDERLAPWRDWLLQLLDAVEAKDRSSMLAALDEVRARFDASAAQHPASRSAEPRQARSTGP